jgi:glycosyltransferase involved in cell wall biosynthesis
VIVTDAGACLDFCDQTTAFLVPAEKRVSGQSCVGQLATAGSTWWYEADVGALRQAMRWAYENRAEAQALGSRAASKIREQFTWERSAQKACERLAELAQRWQLGP